MNLFQLADYRDAIRQRLLELKAQNPSSSFQNLAKRCGVQKTYLSRVLSGGKAELSSDQLFLALDYLGFPEPEREY